MGFELQLDREQFRSFLRMTCQDRGESIPGRLEISLCLRVALVISLLQCLPQVRGTKGQNQIAG